MKILCKANTNAEAFCFSAIPDFMILDLDPEELLQIQRTSQAIRRDYDVHAVEFNLPGDIQLVGYTGDENKYPYWTQTLEQAGAILLTDELTKLLKPVNDVCPECGKLVVDTEYGDQRTFQYVATVGSSELYSGEIPFSIFQKEEQCLPISSI